MYLAAPHKFYYINVLHELTGSPMVIPTITLDISPLVATGGYDWKPAPTPGTD